MIKHIIGHFSRLKFALMCIFFGFILPLAAQSNNFVGIYDSNDKHIRECCTQKSNNTASVRIVANTSSPATNSKKFTIINSIVRDYCYNYDHILANTREFIRVNSLKLKGFKNIVEKNLNINLYFPDARPGFIVGIELKKSIKPMAISDWIGKEAILLNNSFENLELAQGGKMILPTEDASSVVFHINNNIIDKINISCTFD